MVRLLMGKINHEVHRPTDLELFLQILIDGMATYLYRLVHCIHLPNSAVICQLSGYVQMSTSKIWLDLCSMPSHLPHSLNTTTKNA